MFAVSQGMQQRERLAVLRALLPMALMAAIVLGAAAVIDPRALYVGAAGVLLAFGIFRLVRPRARPRWTKMRVNGRELACGRF